MRLARYEHAGKVHVGAVEGKALVPLSPLGITSISELIAGGVAKLAWLRDQIQASSPAISLDGVRLLPPIERPGKYLAIGMNYERHAVEAERMGVARSPHQLWFNKQTSCISGPFDDIVRGNSDELDYEVELGVVIGTAAKNITAADAPAHVFGYLVANDVSARDWQFRTPSFTLGKGFDTHGPIGPWIVTADELPKPHGLGIRCYVNDTIRQESNTRDMIHSIWDQIAYLSQAFTLEPGDLLSTGTPEGVGAARDPKLFLQPGDIVRCEIDRIGAIQNTIVA